MQWLVSKIILKIKSSNDYFLSLNSQSNQSTTFNPLAQFLPVVNKSQRNQEPTKATTVNHLLSLVLTRDEQITEMPTIQPKQPTPREPNW